MTAFETGVIVATVATWIMTVAGGGYWLGARFSELREELRVGLANITGRCNTADAQIASLNRIHEEHLVGRRHQGERIEGLDRRVTVTETLLSERDRMGG